MAEFRKILVANRGEIALRVLRSARNLGYRTVAVYSDPDADAPHVEAADESVRIGPGPVDQSYLDPERILAAARATGAGALHPGYGFLSENADFAEACAAAGLVFIGPPPEPMRLMGNKRLAKARMEAAGVPCIPGYHGPGQEDDAVMAAEAERIGYPVLVKAAAGGGGRGMRLVEEPAGLAEALHGARAESEHAFGSGELLLEAALVRARHVEIQVLADGHGNVVHLGERDCSVQRRHQKVIEEAPSPAVDGQLREAMGAAATAACREIGYEGAGTVEFLLDEGGAFYFMEMNTRLQVEHPVTEWVTGLDLVAWQIRIAAGEALDFEQEQVLLSGHAIEARLYAEDPGRGFLPQTGRVLAWRPPGGEGVRVDHGLAVGLEIGAFYDPLLAKLTAWGRTRSEARRRLLAAVEDTLLLGVGHNKSFLAAALDHPVFAAGEAATDFVGEHMDGGRAGGADPGPLALALAALARYGGAHPLQPDLPPGGGGLAPPPAHLRLEQGEREFPLTVVPEGGGRFEVRGGDWRLSVQLVKTAPLTGAPAASAGAHWRIEVDGVRSDAYLALDGAGVFVEADGGNWRFGESGPDAKAGAEAGAEGKVRAPMTGRVTEVRVAPGEAVAAGQCLFVLEAMKLEHEIEAPAAGTVSTVAVSPGEQVSAGAVLAEMEREGED